MADGHLPPDAVGGVEDTALRRLETGDGTIVSTSCEVAQRLSRRTLGLMFRRSFAPESALWIERCSSIHMFFVRFPLDVAFLDADGRVLRLCRGIRPWRMTWTVRGARTTVELPVGTLTRSGVVVGTVLRLAVCAAV